MSDSAGCASRCPGSWFSLTRPCHSRRYVMSLMTILKRIVKKTEETCYARRPYGAPHSTTCPRVMPAAISVLSDASGRCDPQCQQCSAPRSNLSFIRTFRVEIHQSVLREVRPQQPRLYSDANEGLFRRDSDGQPAATSAFRTLPGAGTASRIYPGCLAAFRERFGRQAFRAVIALPIAVGQKSLCS
jgi:hypothetical protein